MTELLTIPQFADKHPAFTQGSLRKLIFNGDINGCLVAIKRLGRRVLIDENAFLGWVLAQGKAGAQ